MMRCSDEYDGAISGDVEGTSGSYFAKEDVCDGLPEQQSGLIDEVLGVGDL